MRPDNPPLTTSEAAQYLGMSERYVRRLVAERRVSYLKVGRHVRFRSADLDVLLSDSLVESRERRAGR